MKELPSLFVSHGAPTIALWPEPATDAWRALGRALGRPRAILVASAHWLTPELAIGAARKPSTIHDFYGFPRPLYALDYPAPGSPEVAEAARALLAKAGFDATLDTERGLDHGVWVPLREMFPAADIPVVQVSLQPDAGPAHHRAVGSALAPLREHGVLVIGSGGLTHNLRAWMSGIGREGPPPWVSAFAEWVEQRIGQGDVDALVAYRERAPHAAENHPTDEHLLPLFVALGAGAAGTGAPGGRRVFRGVSEGVLAMDAYAFGPADALDALSVVDEEIARVV